MKVIFCFVTVFFITNFVLGQKPMFSEPYSPRIANYSISVTLDPETKKLKGSEVLTWYNHSDDYINELQFHLYLNAFKNESSTFFKESGGSHRGMKLERDGGWGWIEVTSMVLNDLELSAGFEFVQPDDGNPDDQTVLRVKLDQPVKPKETISLNIDFIARLPQVFARTGYRGDFFMVGQWFPKIGVYEAAGDRYATVGQWNCHQFHSNSEFYADYGVYEVTITLPEKFVVGSSGVLLEETKNDDGTKNLTYYCEDIHDFAWTADPNYIVIEDQWRHVNIKFLAHPGRETQVERHIGAVKIALEFFDDWYGEYPYPILTIVDPRFRAFGAGGMEYPTLITAGAFWKLPIGIRLTEMVTIHEFGHNYWYGIMGSNEFEEAWLDEGINTYSEIKIMDEYYGKGEGSMLSLFGIEIHDSQQQWVGYSMRPKRDAIYKKSWDYPRGGYGASSYNKPGLMLLTLENYLGQEIMKKVMRAYYDRFSFKHPTSVDFINTVNDISGQNLDWFFDQVLYGTGALDYKLYSITSKRISKSPLGIFGNPTEDTADEDESEDTYADSLNRETEDTDSIPEKDSTMYRNKVIVSREGEVTFPVEILIRFNNGDEIREKWDGKDRFIVFEYESDSKVLSAEVDPERKVWLDVNFLNNSKSTKTSPAATYKYSTRWFFWMQNIIQFIAIFG